MARFTPAPGRPPGPFDAPAVRSRLLPANDIIVCPCHGSEFAVTTGDVVNAPAPHGLTKLKIVEGSNGNLY